MGFGAEVAAILSDEGFEYMDGPIRRYTGPDVPAVPFSHPLQEYFMPNPEKIAAAIRDLGPANFIYSDGDALFAHGHKRMHEGAGIRPPGLHVLSRQCAHPGGRLDTEGLSIVSSAGEQNVVLLASVPLTNEPGWQPLGEAELLAARGGAIVIRQSAVDAIPRNLVHATALAK